MFRFSWPLALILFVRTAAAQLSGAMVAGAEITIEKQATSATLRVTSNLTPGTYRLTTQMPGFSTVDRSGVLIGVA